MDNTYDQFRLTERHDWPSYLSCNEDVRFLNKLRLLLSSDFIEDSELARLDELFQKSSFPKVYDRLAIKVYYPGIRKILIVRLANGQLKKISSVFKILKEHPRSSEFDFLNIELCQVQLDFIIFKPKRIMQEEIFGDNNINNRFELGIDGLRIVQEERVQYFLPGDAFTRSIHTLGQLKHYLKRLLTDIEDVDLKFEVFQSQSYVSFQDQWVRLYRGYPAISPITKNDLKLTCIRAIDHIVQYQSENGSFLYYYCGASDSQRDHEHPRRDPVKNPYYNILRHVGGAITLLYHFRMFKNDETLVCIRKAIDYLIKQIVVYVMSAGEKAGYVYFNRKGKLGAQGISLYLLSEYQQVTGDDSFVDIAILLKNHILSQITETGEFLYYNIYLDEPVTVDINNEHFSFYYPGEAIIGLASYCKNIERDVSARSLLLNQVKKALKFLFIDRKELYVEHYKSLPSDSWLMMAINELWDIPEMRMDYYKESVFSDADAMVDHMYTIDNGLYADYPGAFYYEYGDHPYPDGARCEGLWGAYLLACKCKDEQRVRKYRDASILAAWATSHLVNIPEAIYFSKNREKTLGGIRFKLTRQWFRVDTIQHVACFYAKILLCTDQLSMLDDVVNFAEHNQSIIKSSSSKMRLKKWEKEYLSKILERIRLNSIDVYPASKSRKKNMLAKIYGGDGDEFFLKKTDNIRFFNCEIMVQPIQSVLSRIKVILPIKVDNGFLLYNFIKHKLAYKVLVENESLFFEMVKLIVGELDEKDAVLREIGCLREGMKYSGDMLMKRYSCDAVMKWRYYKEIKEVLDMLSDIETNTNNFIHGDLRLENIALSSTGKTYLLDWEASRSGDKNLDYATIYMSFLRKNMQARVVRDDFVLLEYIKGLKYYNTERFLFFCLFLQIVLISRKKKIEDNLNLIKYVTDLWSQGRLENVSVVM